jgi:hypothetical protein
MITVLRPNIPIEPKYLNKTSEKSGFWIAHLFKKLITKIAIGRDRRRFAHPLFEATVIIHFPPA